MIQQNSSLWLLIVGPLGFIVYVSVLLGVLWLATRVVRHAWYWRSSSSTERAPGQEP